MYILSTNCLILRVSESRGCLHTMPNRRTQQEQSYAGINYALQGGGRQSQPEAESAKPILRVNKLFDTIKL